MSRTRALQCRPKQVFDHQSWWDCLSVTGNHNKHKKRQQKQEKTTKTRKANKHKKIHQSHHIHQLDRFNIQEDRSNVYKADPGPIRPRHRNGFFGLIEEFQSKLIKEQAAVAQDGGGGRRARTTHPTSDPIFPPELGARTRSQLASHTTAGRRSPAHGRLDLCSYVGAWTTDDTVAKPHNLIMSQR
ncbi:hypothetical protein BC936DRAFT_148247 [Jimgerdemannia flammicorona]|uniref:Uncharacterized protein n=1 Tax=Jimgerdemannia flammicorona TaxID=994334 RepID=A0A433D3F9_9FUNG|nr:hypothetical protein BC936DRAFT_148247 [Jimgerdemannia flammicorona]